MGGWGRSEAKPPANRFTKLWVEGNKNHSDHFTMRKRRRKNHNDPGHAHELTFSCYHRFPLLKSKQACEWLAESIETARQDFQFDVWAYVFMPDHVHLLVRPRLPNYDIAAIRKAIKAPVGRRVIARLVEQQSDWLPKITRQRGRRTERLFWQSGGGYDRNIIDPQTLRHVIDYIHANPVRRGLAEQSWDWKWSSAASLQDRGESPLRLDRMPPEWMI